MARVRLIWAALTGGPQPTPAIERQRASMQHTRAHSPPARGRILLLHISAGDARCVCQVRRV